MSTALRGSLSRRLVHVHMALSKMQQPSRLIPTPNSRKFISAPTLNPKLHGICPLPPPPPPPGFLPRPPAPSPSRQTSSAFASTSAAASNSNLDALPSDACSLRASLFDVPGLLAEEVAEVLLASGATSASVEEHRPPGAPEQRIFAGDDDGDGNDGNSLRVWDRCNVVAYFPLEVGAGPILSFFWSSSYAELALLHYLFTVSASTQSSGDWYCDSIYIYKYRKWKHP
jgi:hypothetical protein